MGDKNQFKTPAFRAMFCALFKTYRVLHFISYPFKKKLSKKVRN